MAFDFQAYRNPYVGTIAELLSRGEDAKAKALIDVANAQAQATQARGQAWGGAIEGIGQIAAQALTAYTTEKQNAPIRAQEAAHRAELEKQDVYAAEQRDRQTAAQGRGDTARALYNQQLSGVAQSPAGPMPAMRREQAPAGVAADGTPLLPSSRLVAEPHPFQVKQNGAWVYDIEKYRQAAAAAGVAVESDPYFRTMSETNQLRQETQAKAGVQAKQQAGLLLGMPDAQLMQNAPAAVNGLRGLSNDDALDSFMEVYKSGDVPQIRAALGQLAGAEYKTPVVPGQLMQSQFGDIKRTTGTPPVQIEGNPFPMMENGREVSAVRVKTADGGSEFRHVDGVTPFTGTLTGMPGKQEDVMRNGKRTTILEGTRQTGDLPVPTPQAPQAPSWDVLTNPTGTQQRYVAKGSREATGLMQQGWKAGGSGPALRGVMSSDANRLSDFDTSLDDTDVLRTVIGDTGTIARIGASMPTWVTELTGGWGEDAKSRNAVIARVKQVIGKALEGGVLRKEDEEKYKDILPTIGDPEAVALSKINGLEAAIVLRKSRLIDSLDDAGYDMQRFRARPVRVRGQTVKMRSPDGAIKDVSVGEVEHYKSLGATVVGP